MPYLRSFLKSTVFLFFLCLNSGSFAQSNFYKFTVGAGYGLTVTFPDTKTLYGLAGYASLDYNLTPFLTLGTEIQKGKLTGGDKSINYGFTNFYSSMTFNGKIHAGEFMSSRDLNNVLLNTFRGIYIGGGVGVIKNNVYLFETKSHGITRDIVFPLDIGVNFYFRNRWGYSRIILNLNLQTTAFLEDNMDGNLNPNSNFNDIYNFYTIGVKYNFGPFGLDRKR